ncbi:MAG TPA: hypothetical protein VFA06_03560 [Actinocrinis sp.]|jgi:hypothetical protein|uniref:hypothetical protein n=1 Tax=Actinocrinis sp. TaxID=1920516 RepID=UPI002D6FAAEB|nr:hypothetical protein [Actinocrinis sp.]HZU54928.1 hypothetical protein [Actinocrinis sp.]
MNSWINLTALWKIVVVGLLAGAGLPALFAVGLRALSPARGAESGTTRGGQGPDGGGRAASAGSPGLALAVLCFAVVLAAIGWGIYSIVSHS